MTSSTDEIAVVGASTSGLFTALLLARAGRRVRVYERARTLAPARRTLIVTDRMRNYLGALGAPAVVNEIRNFELYADGRVARVSLARPDLIVERSTMIHELADEAETLGAKIDLGKRLTAMRPSQNGLSLEMKVGTDLRETVEAGTVVGADGAGSHVARAAHLPTQRLVPLLQAIVRLPHGFPSDTTRVYFRPDETPFFYWVIPESEHVGAVGVIGTEGQDIRPHLDNFLAVHGMAAEEYQAARVPRFTSWTPVRNQLGAGQVYLVGDAAGHVKVTTVGGLVTGFRGALGVAHAILDGGSRELRLLRRELTVHHLIHKALQPFGQSDYVRMLDLVNAAAQRSLSVVSRDEAIRSVLQISVAQPRLLALLLQGLLQGSRPRRELRGRAGAGS